MGALISQNIQYSGATLSQQSTPIGAIIPYMGTTAPSGYLACDGGVYSISLYPLLAGFFETQFGSINYFGGDGTTTFAVPNLQGEFLRGAGTNAHSNQGSGGSVGEHQNGTEHVFLFNNGQGTFAIGGNNTFVSPTRYDSSISSSIGRIASISGQSMSTFETKYTSRPTNTSVLYIIKAKSDRLDKITFAEVDDASEADDVVWSAEKTREAIGPESYSTSEQWTGKYWIDGKKIYQKTIDFGALPNATIKDVSAGIGANVVAKVISITGIGQSTSGATPLPLVYKSSNQVYNTQIQYLLEADVIRVENTQDRSMINAFITMQYTKTT